MATTSSPSAARRADFVVLAKADSARQVSDAASLMLKPVLAMIETPRAVIDAAAIAPVSRGLIAGVNDLAAGLGLRPGDGRAGLTYALQRIVLAARAAGVAAFDGVYNRLEADRGARGGMPAGPRLGLRRQVGHPPQPDRDRQPPVRPERGGARGRPQRLIEAATGGAERHEGRMIESLHVEAGARVLAKARA